MNNKMRVTKILIAEHNQYDIELLQDELDRSGLNYISEIVHTEKAFTVSLNNFKPDIILSDYSFPSFDGPTAFKIRKILAADTPFILVSGIIGEEKATELIRNGVTDYVLKDSLSSLTPKVKRALKEAKEKQQKSLAVDQRDFNTSNLKALIDNTSDLMWSVNKDFNLITSNHPFDVLAKLMSGDTIENKTDILSDRFSDEQLDRFKNYYQRSFDGETFTEFEYTASPDECWSEISFSPIQEGDEIIGIACYCRDITERKKTELKLEQQHQELIKVNSELDRFVYSTSHDLRSPLTSILGLTALIEKETKETHTLKYALMIRSSVNRLNDFIKNILGYSKNNRTELEVTKIELQKTVEEIVNALRNIPDAEGIQFEINLIEHEPFHTDCHRLNTVLENLISNAIKYHKRDGSARFIKVTGKTSKDELRLCIEDNGIGIAKTHHGKIFDMFFRLPSKVPGSGFGLYMVKEIIKKLHGSMEINSEEGKGTSFNIRLQNLPLPSGEHINLP